MMASVAFDVLNTGHEGYMSGVGSVEAAPSGSRPAQSRLTFCNEQCNPLSPNKIRYSLPPSGPSRICRSVGVDAEDRSPPVRSAHDALSGGQGFESPNLFLL